MISLHGSLLPRLILVDLLQQIENLAVGIGIPATIAATELRLHTRHGEAALYHRGDILLHILTAGARQYLHHRLSSLNINDGEVGGSLYNVRIGGNHANHTIVAGVDGIHEIILNLLRHELCGTVDLLGEELHAFLNATELVLDGHTLGLNKRLEVLNIVLRQSQHHLSLERNSIAHITTMPGSQTSSALSDGLTHKAYHLLVGIGTSLVDLQSGMAATQALQRHLDSGILVIVNGLIFQCRSDVDATCRPDDELSPELGVEVDKNVAVQLALGQVVGTIHSRLLITRDERLHGTMLQFLILHDAHDGSHANAVVRA